MALRAVALAVAAVGLVGAAPTPHSGSAGVTVALPQGWHSITQVILPDTRGNDPVARIVVASAPIGFSKHGCNVAVYAFPSTAVAIVVVEWVKLGKADRWASRPSRFTAKTLTVRPPPAIECFAGAGGSAQFADHGRHFGAYVLLGAHAPPGLAGQARAVLDTLQVKKATRS
jgi:hypothetical protein